MSKLETSLKYQMRICKLDFEEEYRFHSSRRWRFDFAFPNDFFAVEVEGGIWTNGRHNRGSGFEKDLEKYSEATRLGWTVYRVGAKLIKSGQALKVIEEVLQGRAKK